MICSSVNRLRGILGPPSGLFYHPRTLDATGPVYGGKVTKPETTSLVIGYNLPNDRSEVLSLINDIYRAFGFKIGVIDFRALLKLAIVYVVENKQHDDRELKRLHGIIEVANS